MLVSVVCVLLSSSATIKSSCAASLACCCLLLGYGFRGVTETTTSLKPALGTRSTDTNPCDVTEINLGINDCEHGAREGSLVNNGPSCRSYDHNSIDEAFSK